MKFHGKSGALLLRGQELARFGEYEFERNPRDERITVKAKLVQLDRFLSRHTAGAELALSLDFQPHRRRRVQSFSFTEDEAAATVTAIWSEKQEEATGTHG